MIKQTVGMVYATNNYSQFKYLEGNRELNLLHLERLRKSIEKKQLIVPIIVNEKMEIIDGQHRFENFKELDLPIYYIINEGYGLYECHELNCNSKSWSNEDFLEGYCKLGFEVYEKFNKFKQKYNLFTIKMCQILLNNGQGGKGNPLAQNFKEGKFLIKDYEMACEMAERILDFKSYEQFSNVNFQLAIIDFLKHPDYNHERMLQKLSYQSASLKGAVKVNQYKQILTEVYNYRTKLEDRIYFNRR